MRVYTCARISAGVGRTGVFITLSIVLERMRYEGVVDIFQTVKMLRTQRPATVQTEVSEPSFTIIITITNTRTASLALTRNPSLPSVRPGPVPVLLPGQSGVPGKLRPLCNIKPAVVSGATSRLSAMCP